MKSFILIASIVIFSSSLAYSQTKKTKSTHAKNAGDDFKIGMILIGKSDCGTCHKPEEKAIGPSYYDISDKYPNNAATVNMLASKIQKGGKGVWGPVPMVPHLTITVSDARKMAKYILMLKKSAQKN
ncbi:MAG: c-type cytochrome [Bacteroidota bacterium]